MNSLILRRPPRPARPRAQQAFRPDEQKVGADGEQGRENRPGYVHGRKVAGYAVEDQVPEPPGPDVGADDRDTYDRNDGYAHAGHDQRERPRQRDPPDAP